MGMAFFNKTYLQKLTLGQIWPSGCSLDPPSSRLKILMQVGERSHGWGFSNSKRTIRHISAGAKHCSKCCRVRDYSLSLLRPCSSLLTWRASGDLQESTEPSHVSGEVTESVGQKRSLFRENLGKKMSVAASQKYN